MTDVTTSQGQEPAELSAADEQVLRERARGGGLKLTGEGGLLGLVDEDGHGRRAGGRAG